MKAAILVYEGTEPIDLATYGVLSMARRVSPEVSMFLVAERAGPVSLAGGLTVLAHHGYDDAPPADVLVITGGPGWELDHIAFEGLTNTPFSAWAPDQAQCAGEETSGGATDTDTDAASDSASSGATGGQLDDEGCGCRSDGPGAPLAPLGLALLALGRRRRRA